LKNEKGLKVKDQIQNYKTSFNRKPNESTLISPKIIN